MTKQLFGLSLGWAWRPLLRDGLVDLVVIGLPRPSLIILVVLADEERCSGNASAYLQEVK